MKITNSINKQIKMNTLNTKSMRTLTAATESKKGIYIAFPTTSLLQSIYKPKNYKTKVNHLHTKIGITIDNFKNRSKCYYDNFGPEFIFTPLFIIEDNQEILSGEKKMLEAIKQKFKRQGRAREWFDTTERNLIINIMTQILKDNNVNFTKISSN